MGCGTIGGYLSDMLVKAGAGSCGGKLTLVDFDGLLPQNIGRHRLGFPDLLSNKAEAMAKELKRLSPGVEVHALPVDVRQAQLGSWTYSSMPPAKNPSGIGCAAATGLPRPCFLFGSKGRERLCVRS